MLKHTAALRLWRLVYLPPNLLAQKDNIKFERIQVVQGLRLGAILSLQQDSQGFMWFGIVGEKQRAQGDIFSDAVNLANRIEGLSKLYGVSIVISEQTLSRLKDAEQYQRRFLGKVQVKGKEDSVSVFEIYDGDSEQVIEQKLKTKSDFEEGLSLYFDKKFAEAATPFNKVLEVNPGDKTAKLYLERSAQFMVQGVPDDWEGVEAVETK